MAIPVQELHVGEAGLDFDVQIKKLGGLPADISAATLVEIRFQKPDGTWMARTATFITDGTDGWIRFTTTENDFDQSGVWRYQPHIEIGPDTKWGNITKFKVYGNIPLG